MTGDDGGWGGLIFISARRRWDFLARVNITFLVSGRNLDHQKSALSPAALALQAGRDKEGLGGGGGDGGGGAWQTGLLFWLSKSDIRTTATMFLVRGWTRKMQVQICLRGERANANLRIRLLFGGNVKKRIWAHTWQTATFMGLRLVRVFLFWRFYPRGSCSVVHFLSLSLSPPAVITLIPFTCAALAAIHIMYSPGLCALSSLFAILSKHAFCLYGCLVFPGVDCSGLPFSVHYWNFRHDNWLLPPLTCFLFLQAFGFWLNRMKGTSSA